MKTFLLSPVISTGSEPPSGESRSLPLISRKGQELNSPRASEARAEFSPSFLGNFGPFPGPVRESSVSGSFAFCPSCPAERLVQSAKGAELGPRGRPLSPSLTGQGQHFVGTSLCSTGRGSYVIVLNLHTGIFQMGETEAQRDKVTGPRSHSRSPGVPPGFMGSGTGSQQPWWALRIAWVLWLVGWPLPQGRPQHL